MGNIWFTIGNFYSTNIFELVESVRITPLIPKISTVNIPERDGVLNFSKSNEFNRILFEDRIATIAAIIKYNGTKDDKLLKVNAFYDAVYNNQEGEFRTTESGPNTKWHATLENINALEDIGITTIRATLQYRLDPFSYGIETTLYDNTISGDINLTLKNPGSAPSMRHTLRISEVSGTVESIIIEKSSGESLYINEPLQGSTIIDFENMQITQMGSLLKNTQWSGDFFELGTGNNRIKISSMGGGSARYKWDIIPLYLFSIT